MPRDWWFTNRKNSSVTNARDTWMRLPTFLIPTTFLLATVSTDAARGQWTTPIASPAYAAGGTAYISGTATAVGPAIAYAPPTRTYQPASTPYYGVAPVPARTQAIASGAYQAQRPAYFDNPSVYTGQPVRGAVQTSYMPPTQVQAYPISPGFQPSATGVVTAYSAPPMTAPPITAPPILGPAPMTYAAAPPAPKREGCLSRFCSKLFGTGYTTSYYRAPVTYYRPVTTMNPATGTMVTVQQPCTAYEQQVQRNPFTTVLPGTAGTVNNTCQPNCPCPPGVNACNTVPSYSQATAFGQPAPLGSTPYNGIGQVGARGTGDYQAMPIPSIAPTGTAGMQPADPNLTPLTGPPPTLAPPIAPSASGASAAPASPTGATGNDLAPVERPTLNKPPTSDSPTDLSGPKTSDKDSADKSNELNEQDSARWRLQRPADSTAMIQRQTSRLGQPDPVSLKRSYGVAEPIRAPSDYVAPYGPHESAIEYGQQKKPAVSDPFSPPPTRNPFPSASPTLPSEKADLPDWTESSSSPARPIRSVSYDRPVKSAAKTQETKRSRHTVWTSIAE